MPCVPPAVPLLLESSGQRHRACGQAGCTTITQSAWGQVPFKVRTFTDAFGEQPCCLLIRIGNPKSGWWRPSTSTGRYLTIKGMQCLVHHPASSGLVAMGSPGTELFQNNQHCVAHNDSYLTQGGWTVTILSPLTSILLKWLPLHLVILSLSKET